MKSSKNFWICLRENAVLLLTTLGVVTGVVVGVLLNMFDATEIVKLYIELPGELFMRALYFSVLPLLSCNIIAMSAKLNPSTHGWTALMSIIYCIVLNNVGGFLGVGVTMLINPGERFNQSSQQFGSEDSNKKLELSDVFPDFLRNMVPDNIIKTLLFSTVTTHVRADSAGGSSNNTANVVYRRDVGTSSGPNILGILMSSLVLGLVAGSRMEKTQPFIALAEAVTEVMTVLIEYVIGLLPFAMISLIASALASVENLGDGLIALGLFVACSVCFNIILSFIIYPLVYAAFARRNLFLVYKAMYRPLITAFSTTSSLVTLPDLFRVCDELGVDPHVVRTIAPFLTSFNANASAAFIASATCFTAQIAGFSFHAVHLIGIGFLAGFNVMALPAVPSASIITVFLILRVFQIPEQAVSLLFIVEFINDRLRTVCNVMSHATCVLTVYWRSAQHNRVDGDEIPVQVCYNDQFNTNNSTATTPDDNLYRPHSSDNDNDQSSPVSITQHQTTFI